MSACLPLTAAASPWGGQVDTYIGASSTNAIYSSRASADFGLTALGRYGIVIAGGEYQYGDSRGDSSHYIGAAAGVALSLGDRTRVFALGVGGHHHLDKGYTFGTDLRGTTVSGDTDYGSAYAGGQLRLQIGFGRTHRLAVNVIAHARFDLARDTAEVTQTDCTVIFCSTPMTKTYDVGGRAIGAALGIGFAF